MKAIYDIMLTAGSRPSGNKQFSSPAEKTFYKETVDSLISRFGDNVKRNLKSLGILSILLTEDEADELRSDSRVLSIEKAKIIKPTALQKTAPYHLAVLSAKAADNFEYENTGKGVVAYVVDSGVNITHEEFEGRASVGFLYSDTAEIGQHGSHVAGLIGSKTYGVAKKVKIVDVNIGLETGFLTTDVLAGLDWIATNHVENAPGVINCSFGVEVAIDAPETSIEASLKALFNDGLNIVIAAGNDAIDTSLFSPARLAEVITVGASTTLNTLASFSNFGPVVDILAPGVSIVSTGPKYNDILELQGTSMSAPIVAGVVAAFIEDSYMTPAEVKTELIRQARKNFITHEIPDTTHDLVFSRLKRSIISSGANQLPLTRNYLFTPYTTSGDIRIYQPAIKLQKQAVFGLAIQAGKNITTKIAVNQTTTSSVPGEAVML